MNNYQRWLADWQNSRTKPTGRPLHHGDFIQHAPNSSIKAMVRRSLAQNPVPMVTGGQTGDDHAANQQLQSHKANIRQAAFQQQQAYQRRQEHQRQQNLQRSIANLASTIEASIRKANASTGTPAPAPAQPVTYKSAGVPSQGVAHRPMAVQSELPVSPFTGQPSTLRAQVLKSVGAG